MIRARTDQRRGVSMSSRRMDGGGKTALQLAGSVWLAGWSLSAGAQQAMPSPQDCAAMADPRARLACYDQLFPPTASPQEVARQAEKAFGLNAVGRGLAADAPARIEAIVRQVSGEPGDGRLFTLDNGQVWRQVESSVLGRVRPGDRVVIKDAAFSSFLLITPAGVPIRVRRAQ